MMTNQEYQERVEELANEIAFNLTGTVVLKQIVLLETLQEEVDVYYSDQEKINYEDLEYETIQALEYEGYEVLDTTDYTFRIAQIIAEDIYCNSENYFISIQYIENELDYYDYPEELDNQEIIEEVENGLLRYARNDD
jgi:hypothetical protein